jgi:drug/metabolite transporter (DMT)-like permease
MLSGAIALWLIVSMRTGSRVQRGNWPSALALFAYAAAFSFAYVDLSAGMGALLLFGAVQATMILFGLWKGERLNGWQVTGLAAALGGLVALVLPGLSAPPPGSAILMVGAGVAWGVYSLRGKGAGDPLATTAGNFLRAVAFAAGLSLLFLSLARADVQGVVYAIASGALTSGVGYAIWYAALRGLTATGAATVQLSVPVIAAIGGVMLLSEPITWRLLGASAAILGGIALVIARQKPVG